MLALLLFGLSLFVIDQCLPTALQHWGSIWFGGGKYRLPSGHPGAPHFVRGIGLCSVILFLIFLSTKGKG